MGYLLIYFRVYRPGTELYLHFSCWNPLGYELGEIKDPILCCDFKYTGDTRLRCLCVSFSKTG
jgi:hypothetical protein